MMMTFLVNQLENFEYDPMGDGLITYDRFCDSTEV